MYAEQIEANNVRDEHAEDAISLAVDYIRAGQVVALPTETVYGLGANAFDPFAVERIFSAKGRPADNPLIVHIASLEDIPLVVDMDKVSAKVEERLYRLASAFWPGPLTCILPANHRLAANVTAGLDTVGVRIPDHPVILRIIAEAGLPIAAPSANLSGRPSPTSANHVYDDLQDTIPLIVDGGNTTVGVESTVIDITGDLPIVLRPGGVSIESLQMVLGDLAVDPAIMNSDPLNQSQSPKSPGMKYAHYAPNAEVFVFSSESAHTVVKMIQTLPENTKVGLICSEETYCTQFQPHALEISRLTIHHQNGTYIASHLYEWLRDVDRNQIDYVFVETVTTDGIGYAVMNRMLKAAGGKVV